MSTILISIIIFLDIIRWLVIISVILSWTGIKIKFIDSILDPLYDFIEKYIPTKIGPLSFTPIVVIIALSFLTLLILQIAPATQTQYYQIINYIQNA